MFKKLTTCLALLLCASLPAIANLTVNGSPYYYSGEGGTYFKFRPFQMTLRSPYNSSYLFSDASDLSVTLTNTTTNTQVPLTMELSADRKAMKFTFSDNSDGVTAPGSYRLVFTGLSKLKYTSVSNPEEVAAATDFYANCVDTYTLTFTISSTYTTAYDAKYPDLSSQPGECDMIGGSYALMMVNPIAGLTHDYLSYTPDSRAAIDNIGWVEDESGNKITDAGFSYSGITLTLTPKKAITTPGTYYLIYPTDGCLEYYSTTTGAMAGRNHISHLKVGPYKVTESALSSTIPAHLSPVANPTYYTDALPQAITVNVRNAANLESADGNDEHSTSLSIQYTNTAGQIVSDFTSYPTTYTLDATNIIISFPEDALKGAGRYTMRWTNNTGNALNGYTATRQKLDLTRGSTFSTSLVVAEPNPAVEDVSLYCKSDNAEELEIGEGEILNVRLNHKSTAVNIYYRWTPDNAPASTISGQAPMDESGDGFTVNSGDITISTPGKLEYYTLHSQTSSEIKTINFVAKPTSAVSEVTADNVSDATSSLTNALPGLYSLSGSRLSSDPENTAAMGAGLYIKVTPDGKATKIIIR